MTQDALFGASPDFPWPAPNNTSPEAGSLHGLVDAMAWPDLTPAERCVAMFVGDGAGGPGGEEALARNLGIPRAELDDLLWSLLRKGFLAHMARWWA